jgi:nitroreductase
MTEPYDAVWSIDEHDYPCGGDDEQILRFALRYAILAPSGHNGQPWHFRIRDGALQVRADRSRALPTIDPDDRELLIACAAALQSAVIALEHFGHRPDVRLLPDRGDRDLLALVRPGPRGAGPQRRDLFDAIATRHCNRSAYRATPLLESQLARLRDAATAHGAWLCPLTDRGQIAWAADLIAEGDRIKWCDPVFRHELAERLIPNTGPRRDGMPGYAFGAPGPLARLAPALVRRIDLGRARASADRALALATPVLAVIGTDRDEPSAWLAAGLALAHVTLQATADGLATSFLSQAIEVPELRPRLSTLLERDGHPQLLLRVGYPVGAAHLAPRRPLADVLEPPTPALAAPAASAKGDL